ncbi:MAG: hypothetical protein ACETVM_02105 [Candidatus Bathyarchaeia archaeon]
MRIIVRPKKRVEPSENHFSFYTKYAFVVLNTLRKPLFQKFLNWMLRKERIEKHKIKDVQIRMYPFTKENGNGLAGKCNSKGEILLYPKKLEFFREQMQEFGKENVSFYIRSRAKAALIHELLHLKYVSDEEKVRELTKKYFNIFTKHQRTQDLDAHNITKMILTK